MRLTYPPKRRSVQVSLDLDMADRVRAEAERRRMSKSAVLREVVLAWMIALNDDARRCDTRGAGYPIGPPGDGPTP